MTVLLEQKNVVLILPDQVVAEFRRNRENKIADAIKGLREQHLNLQFPQICKDYSEYPELRELQTKYEERHKALLMKVMHDVTNATLKADEIIQELFAKAEHIESTPERVARARLRIEIGNPPGKGGSLGDAINWEALLEHMPASTDLHIITDDRDYVSILDENRFKEFLLHEWSSRAFAGELHFYRRLSLFFREHFPQIKLASELEKELSIRMLAASRNFSGTHSAISRLAKHTQFTAIQRNDIVCAAVSNTQVSRIIDDNDVHQFLQRVVTGHEAEIEEALLNVVQVLLAESKTETRASTDVEDAPF